MFPFFTQYMEDMIGSLFLHFTPLNFNSPTPTHTTCARKEGISKKSKMTLAEYILICESIQQVLERWRTYVYSTTLIFRHWPHCMTTAWKSVDFLYLVCSLNKRKLNKILVLGEANSDRWWRAARPTLQDTLLNAFAISNIRKLCIVHRMCRIVWGVLVFLKVKS
jgi:hypothetical protein